MIIEKWFISWDQKNFLLNKLNKKIVNHTTIVSITERETWVPPKFGGPFTPMNIRGGQIMPTTLLLPPPLEFTSLPTFQLVHNDTPIYDYISLIYYCHLISAIISAKNGINWSNIKKNILKRRKILMVLWKFTLKVRFWHFLINISFRTHHLWNLPTKMTLIMTPQILIMSSLSNFSHNLSKNWPKFSSRNMSWVSWLLLWIISWTILCRCLLQRKA